MSDSPFLLAVMGETGSGKSAIAEAVATKHNAVLINADAFQMYRGLDIGTNKPADRERYTLLDVLDPHEQAGVGLWIKLAMPVLERAFRDGRNVVVVGGTGFYIRALFEEYTDLAGPPDETLRQRLMEEEERVGPEAMTERLHQIAPETAKVTDLSHPLKVRRALERELSSSPSVHFELPGFVKVKIGLVTEKDELLIALNDRLDTMLAAGWLDETRRLLNNGVRRNAPAFRAIGYQSLIEVVLGEKSLDGVRDEILSSTVRYAKKQRTWLRSEPGLTYVDVRPFGPLGQVRSLDTIEALLGKRKQNG